MGQAGLYQVAPLYLSGVADHSAIVHASHYGIAPIQGGLRADGAQSPDQALGGLTLSRQALLQCPLQPAVQCQRKRLSPLAQDSTAARLDRSRPEQTDRHFGRKR